MTVCQECHVEAPIGGHDPEKRRQILDGARGVFLALGFDGARMAEIARAAGVSKGTLYVYFTSKQELFSALVDEECTQTAERIFEVDDDADVRTALFRVGRSYVHAMIRAEYVAVLRIVISIADRFPDIGRQFLDSGPTAGVIRLAEWLRRREQRGELVLPAPELSAWQFLVGCHAPVVMPMLFANMPPPDEAKIVEVVTHMVDGFLRAWGGPPAGEAVPGPRPAAE